MFIVPFEPKIPFYIIGGLIIAPYFHNNYDADGE